MSSPLSAMLTLVPHLKRESYPRCACPKWLRWSRDGKQHRQSTGTRIWGTVEKAVAQFEQRLKAGESPATTSGRTLSRRFPQLAETFMTRKLSQGIQPTTESKVRCHLQGFSEFMAARSKFYPADVTATDIVQCKAFSFRTGAEQPRPKEP